MAPCGTRVRGSPNILSMDPSPYCKHLTPSEKYVTRGEYNELKGRFDDLSGQVQRLQQLMTAFFQPGTAGGNAEAAHPANPGFPRAGPSYSPHPTPITPGPTHSRRLSGLSPDRLMKPVIHDSRHYLQNVPLLQMSSSERKSQPPSLPIMRPLPQPTQEPSPSTAGARSANEISPHSIASLASPFLSPETDRKKCCAQTFILGERLRFGHPRRPSQARTHTPTHAHRRGRHLRSTTPTIITVTGTHGLLRAQLANVKMHRQVRHLTTRYPRCQNPQARQIQRCMTSTTVMIILLALSTRAVSHPCCPPSRARSSRPHRYPSRILSGLEMCPGVTVMCPRTRSTIRQATGVVAEHVFLVRADRL